jgi:hypothetical protein
VVDLVQPDESVIHAARYANTQLKTFFELKLAATPEQHAIMHAARALVKAIKIGLSEHAVNVALDALVEASGSIAATSITPSTKIEREIARRTALRGEIAVSQEVLENQRLDLQEQLQTVMQLIANDIERTHNESRKHELERDIGQLSAKIDSIVNGLTENDTVITRLTEYLDSVRRVRDGLPESFFMPI